MTKQKNLTQLKSTAFAFPIVIILSACGSVQPSFRQHDLAGLGRFEYRAPQAGMEGVVVGAPHGDSPPKSVTLARTVSDRMGAGFVAAYGFKPNGIAVGRPVVRATSDEIIPKDLARRSVYREFKQTVREVAGNEVDFYFEFRSRPSNESAESLQVDQVDSLSRS